MESCTNGGPFPASFGLGHIVLLPKKTGDPSDPASWRPITLLNCDYKIFTMAFARRIHGVLPGIVHPSQTCTVPGRSMHDTLSGLRDILHFASLGPRNGSVLSLDQQKAFDRVEHSYLQAVLRIYGFPELIWRTVAHLYSNHRSSLHLLARFSREFPVARGVRQGCPLSPALFVLAIDPLLWNIDTDARIGGLPLPHSGSWKVAAYADDITVLLDDSTSVPVVLRVYDAYASLSGGKLNFEKSKLMPLGCSVPYHSLGVPICTRLKILGVLFDSNGPTPENWTEALNTVRSQCRVADAYELSYRERAYLARSVFCGRMWHLSHILIAPPQIVARTHTTLCGFFWKKRRRPIARTLLSLPISQGGVALPDVGLMNRGIALRTALRILVGEPTPTQVLLKYWLGDLLQDVAPELHGTASPGATAPPRFHVAIHAYHQKLSRTLPDLPVSSAPVVLAQAVIGHDLQHGDGRARPARRPPNTFWRTLTCPGLPGSLFDVMWCFAWTIQPTRDHLFTWNLIASDACPYCGQTETNKHVLYECHTARIFWGHVRRNTNILCPVCLDRRRSCHPVSMLATACGASVLWAARCRAVAQHRRSTPIFLLLRRFRVNLIGILQRDLFSLGQSGFESLWRTHPSVLVDGSCVRVAGVPL